ncbi:hypothetical protein BDP27DRAFT_1369979 [Rhodocollybia butyracea]|uniref:Uncharacterized protein n=1 Tax=Rhodocollybia butyracea TaxID=206335 RepID=A0A9P5PFD9_9AGAR|nr:hypothetical protein BDP27DRAFT_1369979 [Rhodocollybia butyracea]
MAVSNNAPPAHNAPPGHLNNFPMPGENPSSQQRAPGSATTPSSSSAPRSSTGSSDTGVDSSTIRQSGPANAGSTPSGGSPTAATRAAGHAHPGNPGGTAALPGNTNASNPFMVSQGLTFSTREDMEAHIAACIEAGIRGASSVSSSSSSPVKGNKMVIPAIEIGYVGDRFNTGELLSSLSPVSATLALKGAFGLLRYTE